MIIECTKCRKYKNEEEFTPRPEGIKKRKSWCRECQEDCASLWRDINPERVKANKRSQYIRKRDLKTRKVKPCCEICNLEFDLTIQVGSKLSNSPHWDHNHETEQFRGWLCHNCNALLGHAGENIEILAKASEYLKTRGATISREVAKVENIP